MSILSGNNDIREHAFAEFYQAVSKSDNSHNGQLGNTTLP